MQYKMFESAPENGKQEPLREEASVNDLSWNDGPKRHAGLEIRMEVADNAAFLSRLSGRPFKLIVTSPPYNIGKSYEKRGSLSNYLHMLNHL